MRNEPELFAHQRDEHRKFMRENKEEYDIDWAGVIGSISVVSSIGLFGTGVIMKLTRMIKFVLPKIVIRLPTLTLDDLFLALSFIALMPWLAVTIYRKFYSKEEDKGDK